MCCIKNFMRGSTLVSFKLLPVFNDTEDVAGGLLWSTPSACLELSVDCAELPLSPSFFTCCFAASDVDMAAKRFS